MNPTTQSAIDTITALDTENASLKNQLANPPKTFSGLEYQKFEQPGNVGNDLGASSKAHGLYTWGEVASPGGWTIVSTFGAAPYDNYYFYRDLGAHNWATKYTYSLEIKLPSLADLNACQAIEFELQANVGSRIFNCAYQADLLGSKKWRYFNYNTPHWIATGIAVDFQSLLSGASIVATFQRNSDQTLTHQSLSINGKENPINITQPSTPRVESDYLHVAFQTDSNGTFTPFSVGIRNLRVDLA
jgi:hypothetical protein